MASLGRLRAAVRPFVLDAALAALLAAAGLLELALRGRPLLPLLPSTLLMTLSLAWRRRAPLPAAVAVVTALSASGEAPGDFHLIAVALVFAMYSLGAHAPAGAAFAGAAFALLATSTSIILNTPEGTRALMGLSIGTAALLVATPFAVGRALRGRQLRVAESEERVARLERDREERARSAVAEERARIARELHDVIAHTVSVMVVQAGAAEQVLDREPQRAREALLSIQEVGRQALGDLRRLLGMIRRADDAALVPRPGLAQLDALVEQVRQAGVPLEVEVTGEARPLPAGIDLASYRILQEALTNVLRHAAPARAHVRVAYRPDALVVEVTDDGRGSREPASDDGRGLIGMRERVALYGGKLEAGAGDGGGYRVRARLPLQPLS